MSTPGTGGQRPTFEAWQGAVAVVLLIIALVTADALGLPPFSTPEQPPPGVTGIGTPPPPLASEPGVVVASPAEPGGAQETSAPSSETTCLPQSEDVRLRVLSFNTYSARRLDPARMGRIVEEIRAWRADVVLMQEVSRNRSAAPIADQPAWYADRLGMAWSFGVNDTKGPGEYGVATLSRYPIVRQRNTALPWRAGQPKNFRRGVLHTRLDVAGTVVDVHNTHLQPGAESLKVAQMRTVLGTLGDLELPTVVGGDMNAGASSPAVATARTRLRDAWVDAGSGPGLTSPAASPRRRIDYLFYGGPLEARRALVLRSAVSDHRVVLADFAHEASAEPLCVPVFEDPLQQQ